MIKVKDVVFSLTDRTGTFQVVEAKVAQELERQLDLARAMLKEMAMRLTPESGTSMVQVIDFYIEEARLYDLIEDYGLCVTHSKVKAKIDNGQEWAVQTDDYSELFERETLKEAVEACVARINSKRPIMFVDALLTKE